VAKKYTLVTTRRRTIRRPLQIEHTPALLAQIELLEQVAVRFDFFVFQIVQEFPPAPYQLKQTPARSVVFLVDLKMFREKFDSFGKKSDLNFSGTGVFIVEFVFVYNFLFLILRQCHRHITSSIGTRHDGGSRITFTSRLIHGKISHRYFPVKH
jgi:hypothetical protein